MRSRVAGTIPTYRDEELRCFPASTGNNAECHGIVGQVLYMNPFYFVFK